MKIMIASDIHGSARYCNQMIEAFQKEKADRLLILGDILYHGPRNDLPEEYCPREVISMLNTLKESIFCVRGNCDTEVDQTVLEFPILADYCLLCAGNRLIYATHGHLSHMTAVPVGQTPPKFQAGDILLQGHTHIPAWESFGDNHLCLNPGSVSIPKAGSPHSYMTLWGNEVLWKTLEGTPYHSLCL